MVLGLQGLEVPEGGALRLYECPEHNQDWDHHPDCAVCTRIREVIKHNKDVHLRSLKIPRVRLREEVYWPSRVTQGGMTHEGRVIENLDHRPVLARNKDHYRELLKTHNAREAG